MGFGSDTLAQLERLLRPHATRIANMVTRGVVSLVTDGGKLQLVQVGALAGETIDGQGGGGEHMQTYGFSSVPLVGAEAVVIFPGGDRSHPLVIAAPDRRYRPTGGNPGEVTVYNNTGAKITITKDGDITLTPASGRQVLVSDGAGVTQKLLTEQDAGILVSALGSAVIAVGGGGAAAIVAAMNTLVAALPDPPTPPIWPVGTKTLVSE